MNAPRHNAGLILPLALLWLLLFCLLLVQSLRDATAERALANNRQWQGQAFDAAETALLAAQQQLAAGGAPLTPATTPTANPSGVAITQIKLLGETALPAGYSRDRYAARRYELSSTGLGPRNTRLELVAGLLRIEPR